MRCSSERPRVRCLPASATAPFSTLISGLTESIEPSAARAAPMRPPFFRFSRVSSAANTRIRGILASMTATTSSIDLPAAAASAPAIASSPCAIVTLRLSITRTVMASLTASAASCADWKVADRSEDSVTQTTPVGALRRRGAERLFEGAG